MSITKLLTCADQLTFSKVVYIKSTDVPYAICHQISLQTMELIKPLQSIFMNTTVLHNSYQMYRLGPFFTPYNIDLNMYDPLKINDIIVGKTGTNRKGTVYTSYLPDRWAKPLAYFFYYLSNATITTRLYEHYDESMRMILLSRLSVKYPGAYNCEDETQPKKIETTESGTSDSTLHDFDMLYDERLYDILLIILFDDMEDVLQMCRKPHHRPVDGRIWNLNEPRQFKHIARYCSQFTVASTSVHIPSTPDFIEEIAVLIEDPSIATHFRAMLETCVREDPESHLESISEWIRNDTCLKNQLLKHIIEM